MWFLTHIRSDSQPWPAAKQKRYSGHSVTNVFFLSKYLVILAFSSISHKIGMFKLSFYFKLRASKAEHGWVQQQHTLARNCLKYFNSQQFFSKRLQKVDKYTWKFTRFQDFNSSQSLLIIHYLFLIFLGTIFVQILKVWKLFWYKQNRQQNWTKITE